MICFYYGLTAFAATYYFRHDLTRDAKSFILKGVAPLLGGLKRDTPRSSSTTELTVSFA